MRERVSGRSGKASTSRVLGPASAIIQIMGWFGWKLWGPDDWEAPDGDRGRPVHVKDRLGRADFKELKEAIAKSVAQFYWKRAAGHHLGAGLEHGADLTYLRRHLSKLRAQGQYAKAALMALIAEGGAWTRARKAQVGYDINPLCSRCGGAR